MRLPVMAALIGAAMCQAAAVKCTADNTPVAQTKFGKIIGKHSFEFDQDFFLGVPYAQPPVGSLRFMAPKPYNGSLDSFEATEYGNSCYYVQSALNEDLPGLTLSEDCLQLNIVRPSSSYLENEKLPVGVWIHGGSFDYGASSQDIYNLSYPVQRASQGGTPILAISINYRLNGFGFLTSKELADRDALNVGLRDQRMALQWIKENIEAFGGDPEQVTIWGESAGANSIGYHMIAYNGRDDGLFHRGILESGSATCADRGVSTVPMNVGQEIFNELKQNTGCKSIECLQKVSAEELVSLFNATAIGQFRPTIDGKLVADSPTKLMLEGKITQTAILSGSTMDEGTLFTLYQGFDSDEDIKRLVRKYLMPDTKDWVIDAILALYPNDPSQGSPFGTGLQYANVSGFGSQYKRAAAIVGDLESTAPRRLTNQVFSSYGVDVYSYNWNVSNANVPPIVGATHFSEVVYVFGNTEQNHASGAPIIPANDFQRVELGHAISRQFMSFVATGDPNNANFDDLDHKPARWEKYGGSSRPENYNIELGGSHMKPDTERTAAMSFINYVIPHQLLR